MDFGENMELKQKNISIDAYNEIMSTIIKKGLPVSDTLIDMLEEAAKYKIIGLKRRSPVKRKKKCA